MSNTRDVLIELGRTDNEEALVEAGKKVLREGIRDYLTERGLSEAVGCAITLKNGEQFTILSDENPKMDTPMDQVAGIDVKQSAKAGGLAGVLANLLSIELLF